MTSIAGKSYRISFLTSRLVRMEYQAEGRFEDRGTTFARNRDFPEVRVISKETEHGLEMDTEYLHIVYDGQPFSAAGLSVTLKGSGRGYFGQMWHWGDAVRTLGGTARTLDGANGAIDRKSTRLNSSHPTTSRMPSSA